MDVLDGLNPEQRRAAEAVRGPVCILAGAGSGKTTTITRRIAHQVASGAFSPQPDPRGDVHRQGGGGDEDAARARSASRACAARTFHSAALAQLHHFAPGTVGADPADQGAAAPADRERAAARRSSSGRPATSRPRSSGRRPQRIAPASYRRELGATSRRSRADLMAACLPRVRAAEGGAGEIDFEDLLELAIRLLERDAQVRATFRERYRAFTVDEYQDVNLLQQTLLDLWLGDRDDLCVVGDDYQSIYALHGRLAALAARAVEARFPHARGRAARGATTAPRREVLELANRLVPRLGGAEKVLRPTRAGGPEPVLRAVRRAARTRTRGSRRRRAARASRVPLEEIAVLGRTNARLADFEEVVPRRGHPVPGLVAARARRGAPAAAAARARPRPASRVACGMPRSRRGLPRRAPGQARRARADTAGRPRPPRRLAAELDDGELTGAGSSASCAERFDPGGDERARRPPADLPPGEGARVRRGLPAAARGEGAAAQLARTDDESPRSGGSSTSGSRARSGAVAHVVA